jgi:outer membrane receptor for ferrienterochelin and colicins
LSAWNGASAFFGVINLITRKPADIDGLETSVEGGTFETYKTRATYGHQFGDGLGLVLSGSVYHTHGQSRLYYPEYDTPENNHGVAENADADRAQNWLARLTLHQLTFSAGYSCRDKHIPTAQYETVFNDARQVTTDATYFADLKYEGELSSGWQTLARVYYDHYIYEGIYPYDVAAPGDPRSVEMQFDGGIAESAGTECQLTGKLFGRHTVILGAAYRRAFHITQTNYTENPKIYSLDLDKSTTSAGLYAQGDFAVRSDLQFNAGLRYDHFSETGDTLNPRLGAIYQPTKAATFKLLYGTAYREPNSYEQDYNLPGFAKASPGLRPETIQTQEIVYEQYLPHGLLLSVSGYHYHIEDLINQQSDPQDGWLVFQNVGSVTARGLEIELEGRYAHGLLARASYAQQRAQDRRTGATVSNSPQRMAKLNVLLPVSGEKLYAGVELQYLSSLETLAGNHTAGFLLANLTLYGRMLSERVEMSATLKNIFDTDYAYPGSTATTQDIIPQNGRSLRLKLTCRF